MSLDYHRQSVESALLAAMNANYPGTPIKFDNVPFTQPETQWVALFLIDGNSLVTNLGRGKQIDRHVGFVQVDVLVPQLSGSSQAIQLAEFVGKLWRLTTVDLADGAVVRYRSPKFANHGLTSGFYRICVTIPYWRDEPAQ